MPHFHNLTVTNIENTINDAVVLTLAPETSTDFDFVQGQYLTFKRDFDGVELRRCYSICSSRADNKLQVGIKRVDGGVFSTWANETLKIGDKITALPPMGNFYTQLEADAKKSYLMIAAGSGITPILSTIKTILAQEPKSSITLVYANRAVASIMFRTELEDLKNRFMQRLALVHILENDSQNIDLFTGRLDAKKFKNLFSHWVDISRINMAFICGPAPVKQAAQSALKSGGLSDDQIKFELFTSSQKGRANQRAALKQSKNPDGTRAEIILDGAKRSFVIKPGQSLLEAGLANNIDMPHACKAGVCSTCRCKVQKGRVEMIANHALEDYEVEKGYILSCQSYPVTAELNVDYDQ